MIQGGGGGRVYIARIPSRTPRTRWLTSGPRIGLAYPLERAYIENTIIRAAQSPAPADGRHAENVAVRDASSCLAQPRDGFRPCARTHSEDELRRGVIPDPAPDTVPLVWGTSGCRDRNRG